MKEWSVGEIKMLRHAITSLRMVLAVCSGQKAL